MAAERKAVRSTKTEKIITRARSDRSPMDTVRMGADGTGRNDDVAEGYALYLKKRMARKA